ncbi:MAG: hypothetical protein EHM28_13575, partial [Spirochaetaceae bacterium]
MKTFKFIITCLILVSGIQGLGALDSGESIISRYDIIENNRAREESSGWMTMPVSSVRPSVEYLKQENGVRVDFEVKTTDTGIFYIFRSPGSRILPGDYIIKRNRATGRFEHVVIVLRSETITASNPDSYIMITPQGANSVMAITLLGRPYYENVILPVPLELVITIPFAQIIDISGRQVEWNLLFFNSMRQGDKRLEEITDTIRNRRATIAEAADGALDAAGKWVLIGTGQPQTGKTGLNCSGFAKWIVDGFYRPLKGRGTDIQTLKERFPDRRGNRWSRMYEDTKDTYFGLDWTRNLARQLQSVRQGGLPVDYEALDVRNVEKFRYSEDEGFSVKDLRLIL